MKGFPVPNRTKLSNSIFKLWISWIWAAQQDSTQLLNIFWLVHFLSSNLKRRALARQQPVFKRPGSSAAELLAAKEVAEKRAIATFDSINVIEFRNQWLHGWLEQNSENISKNERINFFKSRSPAHHCISFFVEVVAFFEGMVFWCCGCWSLQVWVVFSSHLFQFFCFARTNVGWFHLECRMDWIHWKRCL